MQHEWIDAAAKIILGWTPQGNTACQKQILPDN
jgi:hypothetical protein